MGYAITHGHYPNKIEFDAAPGVITWVILATDGTAYATLALLLAAGKQPWPHSYTLAGTLQPGIDQGFNMLGSLTGQSDAGGSAGSAFYLELNLAVAPVSDNPGALVLANASASFNDLGTLNNVWCRMTSASDKLRLTLRY
jgi:hypothetical protein